MENSGGGFVYKLVSVDSLAVYCDEDLPPPRGSATTTTSENNPPTSGLGSGSPAPPPPPAANAGDQSKEAREPRERSGEPGERSSFLAAGLTDEDLECMFRTSLAGGGDSHSYVVIPASPSFRLRVQRNAGVGGAAGSSKYKVQAFFNEVRGWSSNLTRGGSELTGQRIRVFVCATPRYVS